MHLKHALWATACLAIPIIPLAAQSPVAPEREKVELALPAGVTLIERVTRKGDEIVVPYAKYKLDNGLTVILHPDRSDPLVDINVSYHVGSADEEYGRSGFAHFFEHMMFNGSKNVPDEAHFGTIYDAGGRSNGSTSRDSTTYYETVPANYLETMLWLEADRMGFLLPAVTQEKFEIQRETVKNERGQRIDNRPYGRSYERIIEAMYPVGHPYSWSVIGYIEDLNRANLEDLRQFFLRYYGPNNATLLIGGDFDEAQALTWVEKYFGPIPSGPTVKPVEPTIVSLPESRYISFEDNVSQARLQIVFPTVHAYHPDEPALDFLEELLGSGKSSILYQNIEKSGLADRATASQSCARLHCMFSLTALAKSEGGASLAELEQVIRASLAEFEARGVTDADLQRLKAEQRASLIDSLESVNFRAFYLSSFEQFLGNPNYFEQDLARYEAVTTEDVMRVYRQYVKDQPAVLLSVVPQGKPDAAARPDTWTFPERIIPEHTADSGIAMREIIDDFDRSVKPQAQADVSFTTPAIWRDRLDSGLEVVATQIDEFPITNIWLQLPAGSRADPLDKLGLASLTADMLDFGTTQSSAIEIENRLQSLGSSIRFVVEQDETTMLITTLTERLDETLAIAREMLTQPAFPADDFEQVREKNRSAVERARRNGGQTADLVFNRLLFGRDNAFAHRDIGTQATLAQITLADVKAFHANRYSPQGSKVLAVSNLDQETLLDKLSVLAAWTGPSVPATQLKPFPELAGGTIYLVDKPGAAQSELRVGMRAMPWDATGPYHRARLMNYSLGGDFSGRVNLNLREDKGYTYGASSGFRSASDYGKFEVRTAVRTDVTTPALKEIFGELEAYARSGPTGDEWTYTTNAETRGVALDFETASARLSYLDRVANDGAAEDFPRQQVAKASAMSRSEAAAIAAEMIKPEDMIVVVVGDKATIHNDLASLGRPIVELDPDGNPHAN